MKRYLQESYEFHRQLVKKIPALRGECYSNVKKTLELPEFAEARYVEGVVTAEDGTAYDHAWIILDEKIVDPTLGLCVGFYDFEYKEFMNRVAQ